MHYISLGAAFSFIGLLGNLKEGPEENINGVKDDDNSLPEITQNTARSSLRIAEWILSHNEVISSGGFAPVKDANHTLLPDLPTRVTRVLDYFFPSLLLQKTITTNSGGLFLPNEGMNIRALTLPERKYFSFRREGKVVIKVLEKYVNCGSGSGGDEEKGGKSRSRNNSTSNIQEDCAKANGNSEWALCFRNSSYAGEVSERASERTEQNGRFQLNRSAVRRNTTPRAVPLPRDRLFEVSERSELALRKT